MPEESATSQAVSTPVVDQSAFGSPETGTTDQASGTEPSEAVTPEPTVNDGGETFSSVNPSDLPPELQTIYKSMQADYTRKTSEIASLRSKAQAFEELMNNDQFSQLLDRMSQSETRQEPQGPQPKPLADLSGEELLSQLIENPGLLQDIIDQRVQERLSPLETQYYDRQAEEEIGRLTAKYPDFMQHESEIASYVERGVEPEAAYKIVTYDKVKQAGINEGAQAATKRSQAAQPTVTTPTVTPSKITNLHDAFEAAKRANGWNG